MALLPLVGVISRGKNPRTDFRPEQVEEYCLEILSPPRSSLKRNFHRDGTVHNVRCFRIGGGLCGNAGHTKSSPLMASHVCFLVRQEDDFPRIVFVEIVTDRKHGRLVGSETFELSRCNDGASQETNCQAGAWDTAARGLILRSIAGCRRW